MSSPTAFMTLIHAIVADDTARARDLLAQSPDLARHAAATGADRKTSESWFFDPIGHYMYAGDTALHMAAAGFRRDIADSLIAHGADLNARNRRGAQPLHYAADANRWDPDAQVAVITCLAAAGADIDAADKSGVAPLHRAVRTRSAPAVAALLSAGADPRRKNGSGSTPLHLALQTTGRGGSGTPQAIAQQRQIVILLLGHGADPDDTDVKGRPARDLMDGYL